MAATLEDVRAWQRRGAQERERLEALGQRLRMEAAHLAAAEYRWLVALEEFDREGGWVEQGARSCVEWLSWACGVGPEAGRERLRVAHALVGLPAVSAAFAEGGVSYSKVRAITRIATADNEELLVTYARHATAGQLERVVRDHRRVVGDGDGDEDEVAQAAFERRSLRWRDQDDGTTRLSACLPADVAAEVIAAVEQVAAHLGEAPAAPAVTAEGHTREELREFAEAGAGEAPVASERWDAAAPVEARRADALRVMAETVKAYGPAPVGGAERYQVVVHTPEGELAAAGGGGHGPAAAGAERSPAADAAGSAVDAAGSAADAAGSAPVDAGSAADMAGSAPAEAGAASSASSAENTTAGVDAAGVDSPVAAEGAGGGGGQDVVAVAEDVSAVAGERLSEGRRPAAGFVAGAFGPLAAGGTPDVAGGAVLPARAVDAALDVAGPRLHRGGALPSATARMLACDAALVWLVEDADGVPTGVSEKSRTVPTPLRRALTDRDKGCRFPGCANRRFVDAHHVWHWVNGGPTVLWNLVLLCRFHHRVIHHAGYQVFACGDQTFRFHRPDGTAIPAAAPSPGGQPDQPERANQALGLAVDADSLIPDWDGAPPDYDAAAEVLRDATSPQRHTEQPHPHAGDPVSAETPERPDVPAGDPVSAETLERPDVSAGDPVSAETLERPDVPAGDPVSAEGPDQEA